ncbi:MAG TPA: hypothetical protein VLV49_08020 [Terriglobales bacterium]|nr:hypothetical protein [Terriglobales bacterium]
MKRTMHCTLWLAAFTLFAGAALAANRPAASPAAAPAAAQRAEQSKALTLAAPEDLTGTIRSVHSGVLSVIGNNGVPYDFRVNGKTDIVMQNTAGKKLTMSELAQDRHDQAAIHFVPMSNGNLAQVIDVRPS